MIINELAKGSWRKRQCSKHPLASRELRLYHTDNPASPERNSMFYYSKKPIKKQGLPVFWTPESGIDPANDDWIKSSLSSFPTHQHRYASMERIQLRFVIKENSPLENVLKLKTRFNPGNAKPAFLTELSLFSSELFSSRLMPGRQHEDRYPSCCFRTRCAGTLAYRLPPLQSLLQSEQ